MLSLTISVFCAADGHSMWWFSGSVCSDLQIQSYFSESCDSAAPFRSQTLMSVWVVCSVTTGRGWLEPVALETWDTRHFYLTTEKDLRFTELWTFKKNFLLFANTGVLFGFCYAEQVLQTQVWCYVRILGTIISFLIGLNTIHTHKKKNHTIKIK